MIFQVEKYLVVNDDSQLRVFFYDDAGAQITTFVNPDDRVYMEGFVEFKKKEIEWYVIDDYQDPLPEIIEIDFSSAPVNLGDEYIVTVKLFNLHFWTADQEPVGHYWRTNFVVDTSVTTVAQLVSRLADHINYDGVYSEKPPFTATAAGNVLRITTKPGVKATVGVERPDNVAPLPLTIVQRADEGKGTYDIVARLVNEKERKPLQPSYEWHNSPIKGNKYKTYVWKVRKPYPDIIGGHTLPGESHDHSNTFFIFVNTELTPLITELDKVVP